MSSSAKITAGLTQLTNHSNNVAGNENQFLFRHWLSIFYNLSVHIAVSVVTGVVTYISFYEGIFLFSWHPTLMMIGFLVLMTEAMLTFDVINVLSLGLSRRTRVFVHWVLQAVATCTITASFIIIVLNKNRFGKNHFTSNHGIVGLTAIILTGLSVVLGVSSKFSYQFRHYVQPVNMKMYHAALAVCCYILGMVAIKLGLFSSWFLENVSYRCVSGLIGAIVYIAIYTLLKPLCTLRKKICIKMRNKIRYACSANVEMDNEHEQVLA